MSKLSESSQKVIDKLLDGHHEEREDALAILPTLPDKKSVANSLVERLSREQDGGTRSWIVSGLAAINEPHTVDTVAARLDPDKEFSESVRYWAAIGLAKMKPPDDLRDHLVKATEDIDPLVRAVALRLLIENGFEGVEQLLEMMEDYRNWGNQWAACKVLRREAGHQPLSVEIENKVFPILEWHLNDIHGAMDTQFQAALALGDMTHKWQDAIKTLGQALKREPSSSWTSRYDWARRSCVDALAEIGRPETKEVLLFALQDSDAEIRVRAAGALKDTFGASEAVDFIVEELLRQEEPPSEHYFDALRQIDSKEAAEVLTDYSRHLDSKIAERASRALIRLGGEEAVRTLQEQRTQVLDTYTNLLSSADERIMEQFNHLMGRAQQGFLMSLWMHGIIFGIGVVVLVVSLYVALSQGFETFERYVGVGAAVGSLGTLLLMFYTGPVRNIRQSVTDLVEVNVVFLGYVRQINQIDATFKQLFLASSEFGVKQMKQTVEQIQDSVKNTMQEVKAYLGRDAGE